MSGGVGGVQSRGCPLSRFECYAGHPSPPPLATAVGSNLASEALPIFSGPFFLAWLFVVETIILIQDGCVVDGLGRALDSTETGHAQRDDDVDMRGLLVLAEA